MNSFRKPISTLLIAALVGAGISVPYNVLSSSPGVAHAAEQTQVFSDINQAGNYQQAVAELVKQHILSGYGDSALKPEQAITRAELAKLTLMGFGLDVPSAPSTGLKDVASADWYYTYAAAVVNQKLLSANNNQFQPSGTVTQEQLVTAVAMAAKLDSSALKTAMKGAFVTGKEATRAEAAFIVYTAQQLKLAPAAQIESIKALNPVTLEIVFSTSLSWDEVDLDKAKANFVFDNGLGILNVPQLKTGASRTYIVPTTPQKAGTTYNLTYKGKASGSFAASTAKIALKTVQQVTNDTFELVSSQADGVTDYQYVVAAYLGKKGPLSFTLNDANEAQGKPFQIISSLRDKQVTITPEGGQPITASYIGFTQATDDRQAPKFRLPSGQVLKPGVKYTVTSDWAIVANSTFTAREIAPLTLQSVKAMDSVTIEASLAADPLDELFGGRRLTLTAPDGTKLTAQYRVTTRKGAVGTFDILNGGKLSAGTTYQVTPVDGWAIGSNVSLTVR